VKGEQNYCQDKKQLQLILSVKIWWCLGKGKWFSLRKSKWRRKQKLLTQNLERDLFCGIFGNEGRRKEGERKMELGKIKRNF